MEFTKSYNELLVGLQKSLSEEQKQCVFNIKYQYDTLYKNFRALHFNVDVIENQKDELTTEIKILQAQTSKLKQEKANIKVDSAKLADKVAVLKIKKKKLENEILELDSSSKCLAIKKGIAESKKEQALELIRHIYNYTSNNKCKSLDSLTKQIINKIKEKIPPSLLKIGPVNQFV